MDQLATSEPTGLTMITLSFEGDLNLCRLLCETVDRFVPLQVQHMLVVPAADIRLFNSLANTRRQIVAEESLLPPWLYKLPLPSRRWRKRLMLPRRNIYLSTRGRPVRGWVAQQIMKLAAASQSQTDLILNVDSDAAFVRPLKMESLWRDGKTRLLRLPGAGDLPSHRKWHASASGLLGLPAAAYHGADYIDNLITWRRTVVRELLAHIQAVGAKDAMQILAGTQDFSEYILYGVYCDKVIGLDEAGHFADATSLCKTIWSLPPSGANGFPDFTIGPRQVAFAVQSTVALSDEDRRSIVSRVTAAASLS